MSSEHHDLAGEFPEHSEKIHIASDISFECQKKKRAQLKDQLYSMIVA
jgi:uncharacterized protein YdcH (DUF465 family)